MKIDRLIGIIMLLLDKKRVGAQELAETFEVSPRTIYRDIDAIDMAGIPIRSVAGAGGGFEIMPSYKIDKNVFSAADISAILTGLYSITDTLREKELINALSKVKSFIPADRAKDIELKANRIYVDLSPWMGNRNTERYLKTIKNAAEENILLSFDYSDRHGERSARIAEPYQLILKSNHWYFYGYCRMRNDFRLFRLCRMSNLEISEETFAPRVYPKPQLTYDDTLDIRHMKIKLRFHKSLTDRVLDFVRTKIFRRTEESISPSIFLLSKTIGITAFF